MPATLSLTRLWGGLDSRIDNIAMSLSGLCLAHCLATSVFLALFSVAGGLLSHTIHEIGLALAIVFAMVGLGRGIFSHGYMLPASVGAFGIGIMAGALSLPHSDYEIVWTLFGVALVALGHDLNRRATY
jgi:hypothetical protein